MRIQLAIPLSLYEIAHAIGAVLPKSEDAESIRIEAFTTDSREIQRGDLFIAIRGENVDGNRFLSSAFASGASAAICQEKNADVPSDALLILCEDSINAIGALAAFYQKKIPHKTIAVTGSVGKTTTKECLRHVLAKGYRVHATEGNHNNELGLPYTIFSMPKDTEILILEMGMSGLGEIAYLSKIACPDVAIVTTIGTSHLEHLGTRENICRAKMEITEGMKDSSLLLLNGDEPLLRAEERHRLKPKFISLNEGEGDCFVNNLTTGTEETAFHACLFGDKEEEYAIPMAGRHAAYAALFALAVGRYFGMPHKQMRDGLAAYTPDSLRQNIGTYPVRTDKGLQNVTIIRDCYNAAPESMQAALSVLAMTAKSKNGRAVAFLGDMKELGQNSQELHEQVGTFAHKTGVQILVTYGESATSIAQGARKCGMPDASIFEFPQPDKEAAAALLLSILTEGDTLLFKGSRAMRVEQVADLLTN